jgi:nitric oxide dioxygenase
LISNYLHDCVEVGDVVQIGPPCGEFTLDPAAANGRPIVLLSGGIGITPVMSMLKTLVHHRVDTPVYFIHAARNSRVHALADEARSISAEYANVMTHFRYDDPLEHDFGQHCHSVGTIDRTLLETVLPSADADFYFCGPKPFMVGLYQSLKDWGVDDSRLHFEFFGPRQALTATAS